MECEMESVETTNNKDLTDRSIDVEWQIDSEWINLSSELSSIVPVNNRKVKKARLEATGMETDAAPTFHFLRTPNNGRFLVIDHKHLRLSQKKPMGYSYWVCSIPCCTARCVLDPEEKRIVRFCRDHNHELEISRQEYKKFINALKIAVKENPNVEPKLLYDIELEKTRERWKENNLRNNSNEEEPSLPSFEAVRTAMYNSRNAMLSAVSAKPTPEKDSPKRAGTSRSTRSRDYKAIPKQKSTPSKVTLQSCSDLDELEQEWSSEPHRDADLSDFEAWLEDDVNANIPAVVSLFDQQQQQAGSVIQKMKAKLQAQEPKSGYKDNKEIRTREKSMHETNSPQRKYNKRSASASIFTCSHCPYKSNRHFNVQRHERLAHSTKKPEFSCKECGTSYSLEYRLKLHIKAVHQGEGHHCHICDRTFETMTGLKSHVVTKHKNDDPKAHHEPPPELTCRLCGRVFSTSSHLQKHTSTHIMIQPYRCCVCNKAFMEEAAWLSHQRSCSDAFTVQCCLCSAFVPTAQELMTHMDVVHGRAEYSCHCGKMFPWKKSLLTHQQKCSLFLAERSV